MVYKFVDKKSKGLAVLAGTDTKDKFKPINNYLMNSIK